MGIATRATVEQRDSFPSAVRVSVLRRRAHAPPLAQWTFGLDRSWLQDCSMCCRVLSHIPCPHPQDGMLVAAPHKLWQLKMPPDLASGPWLRAHSLNDIPSWPLVIWPCPFLGAALALTYKSSQEPVQEGPWLVTSDRGGNWDTEKESHWPPHLTRIILRNSLNLPLKYSCTLFYVLGWTGSSFGFSHKIF